MKDAQSEREVRQIAGAIAAARKRAGMTQRDLAQAISTTQSAIARMERGAGLPRLSTIQRIARATNSRMELGLPSLPLPTHKGATTMSVHPRDPRALFRSTLSRRSMLATAGVVSTAVATGIRPTAAQTPSASPAADVPANGVQPDGTWAFTDDRGVTVTLPKRPERIFANYNAAAPLWDFGIRPVAIFAMGLQRDNPAMGNIDPDVPDLTAEQELVDIEAMLNTEPDIYITMTWDPGDVQYQFGIEYEQYEMVNNVVPFLTISGLYDAETGLKRFHELAIALGIAEDDPNVAQAQADFEGARAGLTAAAEEASDLTTLVTYIGVYDTWNAVVVDDWSDLAFYKQLGVNFVEVESSQGGFWEAISFENVLEYPSDILLNSTRDDALTPEEITRNIGFAHHPAVVAGQIGPWIQDFILSYQGMTAPMLQLADTLRASKKVI
ncbi:MAG: helix-turn-helix domain-containing protein [Thermomicrobiales bacterium]|nr:helix-turn-helix domain-containing protein [Thermomicrobiales bacterium]